MKDIVIYEKEGDIGNIILNKPDKNNTLDLITLKKLIEAFKKSAQNDDICVIYSAEGIHIDVSPFVPEQINTIQGNEIAFCGSGIFFHTNQIGNIITKNNFHNNLTNVTAQGITANGNIWKSNYYDDYQGFDRDEDNIGDISSEHPKATEGKKIGDIVRSHRLK